MQKRQQARLSVSVFSVSRFVSGGCGENWCWSDATEATQIRTKKSPNEEYFRSAVQLELMLDKSMPAG